MSEADIKKKILELLNKNPESKTAIITEYKNKKLTKGVEPAPVVAVPEKDEKTEEPNEEAEKNLLTLKGVDGKILNIKIGSKFFLNSKEYEITGTRKIKGDRRIREVIQIQDVLNKEKEAEEITQKEFKEYFKTDKLTLPISTEREEELRNFSKKGKDDKKIKTIKTAIHANFKKPIKTTTKDAEPAPVVAVPEKTSITDRLKTIGLKEEDFKTIPKWAELSEGEKILVIEQISQDTLSRVKETGEQRFQEKNKISFSAKNFNPFKFGKKILKNIGKSYWISKEEKQAIKDVEAGNLKPNSEIVKQIVEKTADMNLDVVEKDGKSFIEFIKIDKNLPEEQQKIIEEYNKVANEYAKMPDSWKNKKAANSKDNNIFKNKNYENYNKTEALYGKASANLLNTKKEQYLKSGLNEKEAGIKAMLDMKEKDFQISTLQFFNTNPNTAQELKNIKENSSWKRLFNNENIWRGIYMGTGWAARTATVSTFGFIAAPLVAGAIGGARARKKAGQKIDTAFMEGRTAETFLERKESGKKGLFDDKNKNRNLLSKTLSGTNINAKEISAFIDADSQIQRLDNLVQKIKESINQEEKMLLKDQLNARIGYIEEKNANGLINYGSKNALNSNYELFKKLSTAQAYVSLIDYLNENKINTTADRRENLLAKIMENNDAMFSKEQAKFKNKETARGAMVAAGFSLLGSQIRGLLHGTDTIHTNELEGVAKYNQEDILNAHQANAGGVHADHENPAVGNTHNVPEQNIFKPVKVEISSMGAIQTINDLKEQIHHDYPDISKAPESVQEFMKTDSTEEAIKLGFYDPNSPAESAMGLEGSTLGFDEKGNLISHDIKTGEDTILVDENNNITKYNGPMADTDHDGNNTNQETIIEEENDGVKYPVEEQVDFNGNPIDVDNVKYIPEEQVDFNGNPINAENILDNKDINQDQIIDKNIKETKIDQNKTPIVDQNNNPVKVEQNETNITDTHKETENILNSKDQEVKNIETYLKNNNDYLLSDQQLEEVNKVYTNNVSKMFSGHEQDWDSIKSSREDNSAANIMESWQVRYDEKTDYIPPYISHLFEIARLTKLIPNKAVALMSQITETPEEFELRCLQAATHMGVLDQVTLK